MDNQAHVLQSQQIHHMSLILYHARTLYTPFFYLTVSVQAQDNVIVECSSDISCGAGEVIGEMTARECCVENLNGFAYTLPGQEVCTVCIGECLQCIYSITVVQVKSLDLTLHQLA